jgi:TRAP-type C4-dicarboxylate transport system substrate-binding protein
VPEVNIGLMPCLVATYEQGMAWKTSKIGEELTASLEKRGVKIISWVWQSGGIASRTTGLVTPDDTKGLKVRGGSREMDLMLKAAGGIISSVPSNEHANGIARCGRDVRDQSYQFPSARDLKKRHHGPPRQFLVHA